MKFISERNVRKTHANSYHIVIDLYVSNLTNLFHKICSIPSRCVPDVTFVTENELNFSDEVGAQFLRRNVAKPN